MWSRRLPAGTEAAPALPARLFLYGTLLEGACNAVAVRLHRHLVPGVPGRVAGQLYAIPESQGWYPALVPGSGIVRGMVHAARPDFDADCLAVLDAYEDVRADGLGEYRRDSIVALIDEGELVADAYIYNVALPAEARPVPQGDFAAYLAANGLTGFR